MSNYNRILFGIHSICPYSIADGTPYGIMKVIGGGTLSLSAEFEELFGGSSKFSWAVEAKTISAEWTATVKMANDFQFELFLGANVVKTAASSTGTVSTPVNVKGTIFSPTNVSAVSAISGSEQNLKDGVYIIKAVSATSIDIYGLTDLEFKKMGATVNAAYVDDTLKMNAAPIVLADDAATPIPFLGIEITTEAGFVLVVGDTMRVNVNSAHNGVSEISIGSANTVFPEHRQLCLAQKRSNGDVFEIDMHRVVGSGMPIPLTEQEFSIPEMAMRLVYDSELDEVARIRAKRGI